MKKNAYLLLIYCVGIMPMLAQKSKNAPVVANEIEPTTALERLRGYEKRKQLEANSLVGNIPFRSAGPTVMSGRVVDIDANPRNPTDFFVAYASGGLWRTQNNGQSFEPLFDNQAVMTIGDIAVDWRTNGQTIWVGTGENNSSRSSYSGMGVYRSTDAGKTWKHLGLTDTQHIGRIVLSPSDPNIAWVAALGHLYSPNTERGLFKTTDAGKTWKHTLFIDENTGGIELQADPKSPTILYAATWHKQRRAWNLIESGNTSGIYKSNDAGETWQKISTEKSGFPQGDGTGRIGLSIFSKNPSMLYAIVDNQAKRPQKEQITTKTGKISAEVLKGISVENFLKLNDDDLNNYLDEEGFPEKYSAKNLKKELEKGQITLQDLVKFTQNANDDLFNTPIIGAEVYRSNDAGLTWKRANNAYLDNVYSTYGYYFGQIWIAPDNPEKIIIVGVPVLKSENGGATFQSIDADNVHADHHALWFNPQNSDHYILGNDGGVNITYDNGKTWFKANTPAVGQFYNIAIDMARPYNVYGGLQDNGVWTGPSTYKFSNGWYDDGIYPYKFLLGGDGMQVQVDFRDNATVYAGYQFGNYFRINKNTGEQKALIMPQEIGEEKLRFNWQAPILLSRHNQDIVYFGSNRFHRSLDKGNTWKTLSYDLTKGKKEGDVPFGTLATLDESPLKFGLLYAGSDDGLIHRSNDGGYTWTKISDSLPQHLWVSRVVASAHNENTVYCTLNGYRQDHFKAYAFVSNNYGTTWQAIGTDLPSEPINVLKEDPKNSNLLYLGTDHATYVSLNKGKNFMKMNGGLPATPIHDLVIHPRDNELIIGTHGRSIWIADISPLQQLTDSVMAKDIYLFEPKTINYNQNWGNMRNKYAKPTEYKHDLIFFLKKAENITAQITTEKGLVLWQLKHAANAGLNYLIFDYSINASAIDEYQKQLNDSQKKGISFISLDKADDGKTYIKPGKYTLTLTTNSGVVARKEIEIKTTEHTSKR